MRAPASKRKFLREYAGLLLEEARLLKRASELAAIGDSARFNRSGIDINRPLYARIALVDDQGGRPRNCGGPPL